MPPTLVTVKVWLCVSPTVTEPKCLSAGDTDSCAGFSAKVAVTSFAASRLSTQSPVPLQPPPVHEASALEASGVAKSLTVAVEYVAAHEAPQVMPGGSEV